MTCAFLSNFAVRIEEFIRQKRALGFLYNSGEYILHNFDQFCLEKFADEVSLTKELCLAWAVRRDTEKSDTLSGRLSPIREFAKYLNRLGESAFIIPDGYVKKWYAPAPYIYTEVEILQIWQAFDEIKPLKNFPARHFVLPAIIRLLYCCGLRPHEARKLKVDDVDLNKGRLYIRESKGHKDRIVMMADDVSNYLKSYNEKITRLLPGREWFFPSSTGKPYSKESLSITFRHVRKELGITQFGSNPPRLYDFRHSHATHCLYHWMHEGKDLTTMLPYLSTYMGHSQLRSTYYYIHLVPGQLEIMSGLDFSKYESLMPEVDTDE